jgi:CDP-2,3-bis-(O-geranylgeranyl)-sn-glycerol synthase
MTPSFAFKAGALRFLEKPLDFGKKYQGFPIFGPHKTWRGLILGILVGILVAFFQKLFYENSFFADLSFLNYQEINVFFLGFLLSFGALIGDSVASFFKRRLEIAPGKSWIPFDQISFVVGAFLLVDPFFQIPSSVWFYTLFFSFFLHIIVNQIGFKLGISKSGI